VLRSDHVIIQNYEEQLDARRLYVALFVKDPYRQSIALTHQQMLDALRIYREELNRDVQHQVGNNSSSNATLVYAELRSLQIHFPNDFFEKNLLDSLWLYGVCLLALIVLLVVILMLMTILVRRMFVNKSISDHRANVDSLQNLCQSIRPTKPPAESK
jgi:flagellar biosynthesis/type III secretory pathway M-ring protein FliF/YscJ